MFRSTNPPAGEAWRTAILNCLSWAKSKSSIAGMLYTVPMKQITLPQEKLSELAQTLERANKLAKELGIVNAVPSTNSAPYRVYNDSEIEEFLKEDKLPDSLAQKVRQNLKFK